MSEQWVDQNQVQMAPPDTWHTLSYNHLLETKTQIMDKMFMARGNQQYLKVLKMSLDRLEALIHQKLHDPRGLS